MEEIPDLEKQAMLLLHEDEYEFLNTTATRDQLQSLWGHPQYRYERARLKLLHNDQVSAFFAAKSEMSDEVRKGVVLGLRMALGLPKSLFLEAAQRERREELDEEELDRSDPDWTAPPDLPNTGDES